MEFKCECFYCVYNQFGNTCGKKTILLNTQGCCQSFRLPKRDIEDDKNLEKIKFLSRVLYDIHNYDEVINNPDLDRIIERENKTKKT